MIILMRTGVKHPWWVVWAPDLQRAQSHREPLLRRGTVGKAQPFPLPQRHLLMRVGKARDDSKATIPNLRTRTTETGVYAEMRTSTKSLSM